MAVKAAVALSATMSTSEDEAVRAIKRVEDETTKGFSKRGADIDAIRKDVHGLKVDSAVQKWITGVTLSMITAIVFKLF